MKPLTKSLLMTLLILGWPVLPHANEEADDARLPLEELRYFTQVFDQIRQAYVEEIDDQALLELSLIHI